MDNRFTRRVGPRTAALLVIFVAIASSGMWLAKAAGATISLSPGFGPPTSLLKVSGTGGFQPGEGVDVYFDSADVGLMTADAVGGFPQTGVYIPSRSAPGTHWITAVGRSSAASAQASVTVRTDWSQGAFDSSHQGWNVFENLIGTESVPSLIAGWTGTTGGALASSAAVVKGIVYVGSGDGMLYAFDAAGCGSPPCAPLWTGATGGAIAASPVIFKNVAYVGSTDGKLYAFAATGCGSPSCAPLWTGTTGGGISSSPTVANGLVYVGSNDGKLYAFNPNGCGGASCAATWAATTGTSPITSSPAAGYVTKLKTVVVFVGSTNGRIYAVNATTGAVQWSTLTGGPVTSSPAFAPNVSKTQEIVYAGSGDGKVYALKGWSGGIIWTGATGGSVDSSPAVANSRVFVGSDSGLLYAYNAADCGLATACSPLWTGGSAGAAPVNAGVVVADGVVYVGRDDGTLSTYDEAGCKSSSCPSPLWSTTLGGAVRAASAIVNGVVYVGSADGILHSYGLPSTPAPPPAPNPSALVPLSAPIRHVVVIFQENHSFDNVLGKLCADVNAQVITRPGSNMGCDGATTGKLFGGTPYTLTQTPDIVPNVNHSSDAIKTAMHGGLMDGFSQISGCKLKNNYACYSQYSPSQIPNLAALAERFVISDRTFATDAAASWGSHVNLAAQTLGGFVGDIPDPSTDFPAGPGWGCDSLLVTPFLQGGTIIQVPSCFPKPDGSGPYKPSPVGWVPTIMDRLDEAGQGWRVYAGQALWSNQSVWAMCPSFAGCIFGAQAGNVQPAAQLITDAQNGTLPSVSYAMPFPGKGAHASASQHNGTSMLQGDNQIGADLAALMNGPEWRSTAIFITYDDCGCFYDHVNPLQFNAGYGVRLPMVIVSPYARSGYTDSGIADITSISAYIEHTLAVAPVGTRDAAAYDYSSSFDYTQVPQRPVSMANRPVPRWEIEWLKAHPEDEDDPT